MDTIRQQTVWAKLLLDAVRGESALCSKQQESTAGLIYKDFKRGEGNEPVDGEQVTFAYTAYNESGGLIDSSYKQGRPAETRLGIQGLIPGMHVSE